MGKGLRLMIGAGALTILLLAGALIVSMSSEGAEAAGDGWTSVVVVDIDDSPIGGAGLQSEINSVLEAIPASCDVQISLGGGPNNASQMVMEAVIAYRC